MNYIFFIMLFLPPLLGVYSFRKEKPIDFIYKYLLFVLIVNLLNLSSVYIIRKFQLVHIEELFESVGLCIKYMATSCVYSIVLGFFANLFSKNIKISVNYKDQK